MARNLRAFPKDLVDVMVDAYKSGSSFTEISKSTGVRRTSIHTTLKRVGVIEPRKLRKYGVDESYFDAIDNENKAYWFGFLLADGYVYKKKSRVSGIRINLSSKDREHLEKFRKEIRYEGKIQDSLKTVGEKQYKLVSLDITCSRLSRALVEKGINKVKREGTIDPLGEIRKEFLKDLVRGMFDGDGMAYFHKPSKQVGIGFCDNNRSVVEWFQERLREGSDLGPVKINESKSGECFRFQYRGNNQVQRIYKWLYTGGVHLERKREILERALNPKKP